MTQNPDAPHRAVIWLHMEVHEVNKLGECGGNPVKTEKLVLCLDGENREACLNKISEAVEELRSKCKQK